MKNLYKTLFVILPLTFCNTAIFSQVTATQISGSSFGGDISDTNTYFATYVQVTNLNSDPISMKWIIDPEEDCVEGWEWAGCDNLLCISELSNINDEGIGAPFILGAGESYDYSLRVYPWTFDGCCNVQLRFEDMDNLGEALATVDVQLGVNDDSCFGTNVDELSEAAISFYPNPVNDILNLDSDQLISEVIIYDLIGNVVFSKVANQIRTLDLSELSSGAYLLAASTNESSEPVYQRILKR